MNRTLWMATVFLAVVSAVGAGTPAPIQRSADFDAQLTGEIDHVLQSIATIKPGMTRQDLSRVFTEEGGLSTPLRKTYVYKGCPYIKVDVDFAPVANKEDGLTEMPEDKIVKMSQPYLQYSAMD